MKRILRGDIYYADLGPVVGSEQNGPRPVVVLQNNTGNRYSPTVIVATVTSRCSSKKHLPTHVGLSEVFLPNNSIVLLEQIRTIDKLRLKDYLGKLDKSTMQRIERALAISLGMACGRKYNNKNEIHLSLCDACAQQFYNSPAHSIRRSNISQSVKETCTYCGYRKGFDFLVKRKDESNERGDENER